ncbi:MAG: GIY-YIG nuclease family protein [Aequorivita sp.]
MAYTYILYSEHLDTFYIGACHKDLCARIINHNLGKYGSQTFTSKANDWVLFLKFELENYPHVPTGTKDKSNEKP